MRTQAHIWTRFPISGRVLSRWTWKTSLCSWISPQAQWVCSCWQGLSVGEGIVWGEAAGLYISSPRVHHGVSGYWCTFLLYRDHHFPATTVLHPTRSMFGQSRKTLERLQLARNILERQPQSRLPWWWSALLLAGKQTRKASKVHEEGGVVMDARPKINFWDNYDTQIKKN